jgi:predicted ABC-type transport system involved in lysophospholipase L1 biosynthesis ATPase subunit
LDAAVRFIDAVLDPVLKGSNRSFEPGTISAVVTAGEDVSALLVRVLTGLTPLEEGKVLVLGHDLGLLSRDGRDKVRRRIGIVYPDGGLISNLKVLENVTLPLLYHTGESSREIERRAIALLERFGCGEVLFELPGNLSASRRRRAGFARAFAPEPEVIVYHWSAGGLDMEERDLFLREAVAFHGEAPGRTTIFLTPHAGALAGAGTFPIVHLTRGLFE